MSEFQENKDLNNEIKNSEVNGYPRLHPVAAGMIAVLGTFFLYQIVGGLISVMIVGLDLTKAPVQSVRMLTMAMQMLFILLPAIILAKGVYGKVESILRIKVPVFKEVVMFTAGFAVLMMLLQNYLYIQNAFITYLAQGNDTLTWIKNSLDAMDKMVNESYMSILNTTNAFDLLFVVIVIAITPAICEEFLYRGFIQKSFELKLKPFTAIILTSFFFAISHFSPYGLLALMSLGFYFGYAVYKTDSLFTSVVLHFMNNFISVVVYYIFQNDDFIDASTVNPAELNQAYIVFFVTLVLFAGIMLFINRYYKNKVTA